MYAQLERPVVLAVHIGKQLSRLGTAVVMLAATAARVAAQDTLVVSVKSDSGKPLPDALVRIANPRYGQHWARGSSDSAGIARLETTSRDSFTLEVLHIGYQPSRVPMRDASAPITVVMKRSTLQLTNVCLTYAIPAIYLAIDSAISSGTASLTGRVRDGSFEEVERRELPSQPTTMTFAVERVGTYDIEVTAPGYERWTRSNVRIVKDQYDCHVLPQAFRVRLTPKK
jgi:hypothetical protein